MQPALRSTNHGPADRIDGHLSLTTPEGVRLRLAPAGPRARAVAWLVDVLVVGLLLLVLSIVLAFVLPDAGVRWGLRLLLLFVLWWGYPILFEQYFKGRTLGKKFAGICVVREDGLPVGWRESVVRNLLLSADFLPFLYAAGLTCMLFDPYFRRLGDLAAGTIVVYQEPAPARIPAPDAEPAPLPFPLLPEQQRLLIGLFEREKMLPPARVEELATLAEPLTGLTGAESLERLRSYVAGLLR